MIQRPIRGIVHGRTIELSEEPGCPEGQTVEVELREVGEKQLPDIKQGSGSSELSEDEWNAWEATMAEIVALRKHD